MPALPLTQWLAILACFIASAVPAAGVVVCLHDGVLEIGLGDDCPCDQPTGHADCHHHDLDGGGELVAAAPRVAPPVELDVAASPRDVAVPEDAARSPRGGRAPPDAGDEQPRRGGIDRPWIARHLEVRRVTSLLV